MNPTAIPEVDMPERLQFPAIKTLCQHTHPFKKINKFTETQDYG